MSKRLQVLLEEAEFDDLRAAARQRGIPVSEWVREALRRAHKQEPGGDIQTRLRAVRTAARHEFPTADIDDMLAEVERGYAGSAPE